MDKKNIKKFIEEAAGGKIVFQCLYLPMGDDRKHTKEEIINGNKSTKMQVYYKINLNSKIPFVKPFITINKYWIDSLDDVDLITKDLKIKATLLHEIGHAKMCTYINKSKARGEYLAHMWAIKKSKELCLHKVKDILEENIISWQYFNWNKEKDYRRYILAYKMYKKVYKIVNGIEPEVKQSLDDELSNFYKNMEKEYAKENNL